MLRCACTQLEMLLGLRHEKSIKHNKPLFLLMVHSGDSTYPSAIFELELKCANTSVTQRMHSESISMAPESKPRPLLISHWRSWRAGNVLSSKIYMIKNKLRELATKRHLAESRNLAKIRPEPARFCDKSSTDSVNLMVQNSGISLSRAHFRNLMESKKRNGTILNLTKNSIWYSYKPCMVQFICPVSLSSQRFSQFHLW